jgi:hypothetical protein
MGEIRKSHPPSGADSQTTTHVIPAEVAFLAYYTFPNAYLVEEVRFESGSQIRRLEIKALYRYRSLKSICIPTSVEVIGGDGGVQPTRTYSQLEIVTFEPNSKLREIERGAFRGCRKLKHITIPASLEKMSWTSFPVSEGLEIDLEPGNRYFAFRDDFLLDFQPHRLLRYFGTAWELLIPDDIEQIGEQCFTLCKTIRFVRFGSMSRLSSIESSAFMKCSRLAAIAIPSGVTFLGEGCFSLCSALVTVSFGAGSQINTIPARAFSGCRFQTIVLPSTVNTLESSCFQNCDKLVDPPFAADSQIARIADCVFFGCSRLRSMAIPSSIEHVGRSCFARCASLRQIKLPSPSNLRELLHLPPDLRGCVSIPESVEILAFSRFQWFLDRTKDLTLAFGRDSRLAEVRLCIDCGGGSYVPNSAFLQVSTRSLKLFRNNMEFETSRKRSL